MLIVHVCPGKIYSRTNRILTFFPISFVCTVQNTNTQQENEEKTRESHKILYIFLLLFCFVIFFLLFCDDVKQNTFCRCCCCSRFIKRTPSISKYKHSFSYIFAVIFRLYTHYFAG